LNLWYNGKEKTEVNKMPNPLPRETRENIIHHHENGAKNTEIVKWLRVSESSVKRIIRLYKEGKSIEAKTYKRGRKPAFCEAKLNKIIEKIAEQPDITLEELVEHFKLNISISALCRKLLKKKLSFKKRRCFQKNNSAQTCNGCGASGWNI